MYIYIYIYIYIYSVIHKNNSSCMCDSSSMKPTYKAATNSLKRSPVKA